MAEQNKIKYLDVLTYGFILIIGSVLLFFGHNLDSEHAVWLGLLKGLGSAAVIASILGLTVDLYTKEKLAKEIANDVSTYMALYRMPKGVQNEVADLSRKQFYRDMFHIDWTLERSDDNDHLLLTTTVEFSVTNISDKSESYIYELLSTRSMIGSTDERQILNFSGPGYKTSVEKAGDVIGKTDSEGGLSMKRKFTLKKNSKENEFRGVIKEPVTLHDSDTYVIPDPTINLSATVSHPDDFSVFVGIAHRNHQQFKLKSSSGQKKWEFKNDKGIALLPYQSLIIQWSPTAWNDGR